jgi:DNA-binding response OmpR family regulator
MTDQSNAAAYNTQRRILIVDDIEDNRIVLDRHLRRAGYQTEVCVDGIAAIASISERLPDLVLLDWMMPGLSGIDTLRAIRERADKSRLPVIMCTAIGEEISIVSALEAGANDYIMKPLNVPILLARLKSELQRKDAMDALQTEKNNLEVTLARRTRDLFDLSSRRQA